MSGFRSTLALTILIAASPAECGDWRPARDASPTKAVPRTESTSIEQTASLEALDKVLNRDFENAGDLLVFETEQESDPPPALESTRYLPEGFTKPAPLAFGHGFLDPEPIRLVPRLRWFGSGNQITPELTVYGFYSVFATAFEENDRQVVGLGHDLAIDFDLSFGGSERIHALFQPLSGQNGGGSFLQLNEDVRYVDNSHAPPTRLWLEANLAEVASGIGAETTPLDIHLAFGLFPYVLHNSLLIDDNITGLLLTKNTMTAGPLSNLNVQGFGAFHEVDAFGNKSDTRLLGMNANCDWGARFLEFTYAHLWETSNRSRNQDFVALSATQLLGRVNFTGRVLANIGDTGGSGSGQLYVFESNRIREFRHHVFGFESVVGYCNAFWATAGWNPISGGNFDRLRSTFAVNPLVQLTLDPTGLETRGVTLGAEFFALEKDLALIPEASTEVVGDDEVVGLGLRLRRKFLRRSQIELFALGTLTGADALRRNGIFLEVLTYF